MRRPRVAAGLTAGVLVAALLASCTPGRRPAIGLAVRDGQPVVVVVACRDGSAEVSLRRVDGVPAVASLDPDYPPWSVHAETPDQVTEIALFEPLPAGWRWRVELLSSLDPAAEYRITGYASRAAIPVTFTVADLGRLKPDDVLVETVGGERGITPHASFVSWAAESCP